MPRRLPLRPAKVAGNLFVMFLFCFIAFVYYAYVFRVWAPKILGKYGNALIRYREQLACGCTISVSHTLLHASVVSRSINDN
jgi:hypothetical protein